MKKFQILLVFLPFFGMTQIVNEQKVASTIGKVKLYLTAGQ